MKQVQLNHKFTVIFCLLITFLTCKTSFGQTETRLTVRVLSKDAKFIGTGMGGARIKIIDLRSGETLAEGITEGETGNTGLLVSRARERYGSLAENGDAGYSTTLELTEPTKIQVLASAPLESPENMITVSSELWIIPGKHIEGDGFIIEMPGFSVSIQEPIQYLAEKDKLEIRAKVIMLCGCPTEPGGLWDSSEMQIEALIYRNGNKVATSEMSYRGENSIYSAQVKLDDPGEYQIYVFAFDPRTSNTGVDTVIITY